MIHLFKNGFYFNATHSIQRMQANKFRNIFSKFLILFEIRKINVIYFEAL